KSPLRTACSACSSSLSWGDPPDGGFFGTPGWPTACVVMWPAPSGRGLAYEGQFSTGSRTGQAIRRKKPKNLLNSRSDLLSGCRRSVNLSRLGFFPGGRPEMIRRFVPTVFIAGLLTGCGGSTTPTAVPPTPTPAPSPTPPPVVLDAGCNLA